MTKTRSPNYPSFNLGDAIGRIRKIYKAEHTHSAEREVIAKDLGYTSLNGASLTVIATLVQYGLLEKAGSGLKVSDDAVTIIELPQGSPERMEAIRRMAFNPKLFAELHDNFGDRLPSGENLRLWLIRKGFNQKAADGVIRVYRESLELVNEESEDYNSPDEKPIDEEIQETVKPMYPPGKVTPEMERRLNQPANMPIEAPADQLHFPLYLSKGQKAILYVPATMSKREFELLKKQIENSLPIMEATAVLKFERGDSVKVISEWSHKNEIGIIDGFKERFVDMGGLVDRYLVKFPGEAEPIPYDDNELELVPR